MSKRPSRAARPQSVSQMRLSFSMHNLQSLSQMEGYLKKQGGSKGGTRSWKKRWFVLRDDVLYYYKSKEASVLLGVMPLKKVRIADLNPEGSDSKCHPPELLDEKNCFDCKKTFSLFDRRHHCKYCGHSFCGAHANKYKPIPKFNYNLPVRVCNQCYATASMELQKLMSGQEMRDKTIQQNEKRETSKINKAEAELKKLHEVTLKKDKSDRDKEKEKEKREEKEKNMKLLSFTLPDVNKQNMFGLKNLDRELWLYSESLQEKNNWIAAINQATEAPPKPPPVSQLPDFPAILEEADEASLVSLKEEKEAASAGQQLEEMWQIDYKDVELTEKIGDGNFGEVFRGTLWGTPVAIKTLKTDSIEKPDELVEELKQEVEILSKLRHPNIVLYIGACTKLPNVCIMTEWCGAGDLFSVLHKPTVINTKLIISMALGIAQGMNYLHSLPQPIIHRDLKSHNVLLDRNFNVKVADFGLSHVRTGHSNEGGAHYGVLGTPEWMSPEVMEGSQYNEKIDIYSFGIVMCELVSRLMPFHDIITVTSYHDIVDAVLDNGMIPSIPEWCDDFTSGIIINCLDRNPADRPTFTDIIMDLRDIGNLKDEEFFVKYDIPRLKEQLQSSNSLLQASSACEIAELVDAGKVSRQFMTMTRKGTFRANKLITCWFLDEEDALELFSRCAFLLDSCDTRVQRYALRCLGRLLKLSVLDVDERNVLTGHNTINALIELLDSDHEATQKDAAMVLLVLEEGSEQAERNGGNGDGDKENLLGGLDDKSLSMFESIVQQEMKNMQEQLERTKNMINIKAGLLQGLKARREGGDYLNKDEKAAAKQERLARRVKLTERAAAGDDESEEEEEDNSAELPSENMALLKDMPGVIPMPESFMEYYTVFKHDGFGLWLDDEDEDFPEWKNCYLLLEGYTLRLFDSTEDDPGDPRYNIDIRLGDVKFARPRVYLRRRGMHFVYSFKSCGKRWYFAARDENDQLQWANQIANTSKGEGKLITTAHIIGGSGEGDATGGGDLHLEKLIDVGTKDMFAVEPFPPIPLASAPFSSAHSFAPPLNESFVEFFGDSVRHHGYVLTKTGDEADEDSKETGKLSSAWAARYCLVLENEAKLYENHECPADDDLGTVYLLRRDGEKACIMACQYGVHQTPALCIKTDPVDPASWSYLLFPFPLLRDHWCIKLGGKLLPSLSPNPSLTSSAAKSKPTTPSSANSTAVDPLAKASQHYRKVTKDRFKTLPLPPLPTPEKKSSKGETESPKKERRSSLVTGGSIKKKDSSEKEADTPEKQKSDKKKAEKSEKKGEKSDKKKKPDGADKTRPKKDSQTSSGDGQTKEDDALDLKPMPVLSMKKQKMVEDYVVPFKKHFGDVVHHGYLHRQKGNFMRRGWVKDYVVMEGICLHFYPSHVSPANSPEQTIYLANRAGKPFKINTSSKREFCIEIINPSKSFLLAAESEQELAHWLIKIRKVLESYAKSVRAAGKPEVKKKIVE